MGSKKLIENLERERFFVFTLKTKIDRKTPSIFIV